MMKIIIEEEFIERQEKIKEKKMEMIKKMIQFLKKNLLNQEWKMNQNQ